jgi:hypothetical protein
MFFARSGRTVRLAMNTYNSAYPAAFPAQLGDRGQMTSDQVTLALGGELDPGLIRPLTGDDYLGVVMPIRI